MKAIKLACVGALAAITFANPAAANINEFIGEWKNVDSNARGVIRLTISYNGPNIDAHVWGSCKPTPCDWGTVQAIPYGGSVRSPLPAQAEVLRAEYDHGFARQQVIIRKAPNKELRVEVLTHFTDSSGRSNYFSADLFSR